MSSPTFTIEKYDEKGILIEVEKIEVPEQTNEDLVKQIESELWAKLEELRNLKSQ